jgi:zinc transport system substrate-binding protein
VKIFTESLYIAVVPVCAKTPPEPERRKIQIVVSLFPLYDFTRTIGGDKVKVTLLLLVEAHSFRRNLDIIRANKADLFIYTNRYMEPWAKISPRLDPGRHWW